MNLNIGGGRGWAYEGWLNLDASTGFHLTPDTVFPVDSAETVYSSHCFEHLDDEAVDQLLRETRRVLQGTFVLKTPDFDAVLEAWRKRDEDYLSAERWGMSKVIPTWKNRGVENNIHSRASMIFCGWWNDAYGDEFGQRNPEAEEAYHGPAAVFFTDEHATNELSFAFGPHWLSMRMREEVERKVVSPHFNHRNAWSRQELAELLQERGFSVEMDVIPDLPIPGLLNQKDISLYAVCT